MLLEHERHYGLGMDARISYALGTRTLSWVWAWMLLGTLPVGAPQCHMRAADCFPRVLERASALPADTPQNLCEEVVVCKSEPAFLLTPAGESPILSWPPSAGLGGCPADVSGRCFSSRLTSELSLRYEGTSAGRTRQAPGRFRAVLGRASEESGCRCGARSRVRIARISQEELQISVRFVAHLTMLYTRLDSWSEG